MKQFKNYLLPVGLLLSLTTVISSCDDDDDAGIDLPANEIRFDDIQLTGQAEVQNPPVTTTGSGTLDMVYNEDNNRITYVVSWSLGNSDDETVGMHFHGPASKTENAAPVIGIQLPASGSGGYNQGGSGSSSGTLSGQTRALTQEEEDQLLDGLWYLNIHSTTYPDGELRGQIE